MPRERLFTRPFVLCSVANLAQGMSFNLFLHFPGFLKELGAGEVQIGFIFGLTAVAAILARPPIGRSMDTRGRRGVILVGGALNLLVCALYLSVTALGPWIYLIRVLHGLSEAMLFTSLFTYAADYVPAARRTEGLALFGVSGMLPISLSGVLGDALLERFDYTALFAAALAFAALSLLLSLPLRDRPRSAGAHEPSRGFLAALRQAELIPLWWMGGVFAFALAAVFTFTKTFVMETGLGSVGAFFSAYAGAAIAMRVLLGWVPDRVGPKRALFPSLASLATGLTLLALAETSGQVATAGVLCGFGHGFAFPILFGLVVSRARETERGSAMAIYTALFDGGVLIGGPSFGAVIAIAGYPAMFATAALAVVAGALLFAVWDRQR
ncbi:MAG: MFS transporter [Myxococcota bacterium]